MLVEVKPIPVVKWHGKKDGESFALPKVIEVLYDASTGKYASGLTDEEAATIGAKIKVDLTNDYVYEEPHPYYSTKQGQIQLENKTMIFDTDRIRDYVKVANMKASKFVANSQYELEQGLWPDATHVIFDEAESIQLKATRLQLQDDAREKIKKLSPDQQGQVVYVITGKSMKKQNPDFIRVEIAQIIEDNPAEIVRIIEMGKENVYIRATLLEALGKGILTKEGGAIFYMGDMIAADYEEAVKWFNSPDNQIHKVKILEKMTA